jgi:hypothetical protein
MKPANRRVEFLRSLLRVVPLVALVAHPAAADTEPPRLRVDAPAFQQEVSGTIQAAGWATDASGVALIGVQIDGAPVSLPGFFYGVSRTQVCAVHGDLEDPNCPNVGWVGQLDTTLLANGPHILRLLASDGSLTATFDQSFLVANAGNDVEPPLLWVDVPAHQQQVSGTIQASGWATDASGVDSVSFTIDNSPVTLTNVTYGIDRGQVCQIHDLGDPNCPNVGWIGQLDTNQLTNGTRVLRMTAVDAHGNPATFVRTLVVANAPDTTPPLLSIDVPAHEQPVTGSVLVSGWATDRAGVTSVTLTLDDLPLQLSSFFYGDPRAGVCQIHNLGDPNCPNVGWSGLLDTATLGNGSHVLRATATDAVGNPATFSRTFVVANANPDTAPPLLWIDVPAQQQQVAGTIQASGWATDASGIDVGSMSFTIDGNPADLSALYGIDRAQVCQIHDLGDPNCPNVGWAGTLNVGALTNSTHVLRLTALDALGHPATFERTFMVANPNPDDTPPLLWIDVPAHQQQVAGAIQASGWATDASGVDLGSMSFTIDGIPAGLSSFQRTHRGQVCQIHPLGDPNCPNVGWSGSLDTTLFESGPHLLRLAAHDPLGNPATFERSFVIANPDFSITATPASRTIERPGTTSYQVSVGSLYGFSTPVSLAVEGMPNGVTAAIQPTTVAPGGSATLSISAGASAALGNHPLTVTGQAAGRLRSATVGLKITRATPTIDTIAPQKIPVGQVSHVTLTGNNFGGATVALPLPAVGRPVPLLSNVVTSADGRRIDLDVDARDSDTAGMHALAVTKDDTVATADLRIAGPGPIVDAWTPSQATADGVYLLSIIGTNLQGATVTSTDLGALLYDIDSSSDESISGLLIVDGPTPGPFLLRITDGAGRIVDLNMNDPSLAARGEKHTVDVLESSRSKAAESGQTVPRLLLQDFTPTSRLTGSLPGVGEPPPSAPFHGCGFNFRRRIVRFVRVYALPLDALGNVNREWLRGVPLPFELDEIVRMGGIVASVSFNLEFSLSFDFCAFDNFQFCVVGSLSFDVPGFAGHIVHLFCCEPLGNCFRERVPATGSLSFFDFNTDRNCVVVQREPNPGPGGQHFGNARLERCCDDAINVSASGTTLFAGVGTVPFDGEAGIINTIPELCEPITLRFGLFLDVDGNNFDSPGPKPIEDFDDSDEYVPCSDLTGRSVPHGSLPQRVKLVAAYLSEENGFYTLSPPPLGVQEVAFTLSDTSRYSGQAMNWPPVVWNTNPPPDFFLQGPVTSPSASQVALFDPTHVARVDLLCDDYGGHTKVTAAPVTGGGPGDTATTQIPAPSGAGNLLPSAGWKAGLGLTHVASAGLSPHTDSDTAPAVSGPPTWGLLGDGLSSYEEYRGFVVGGQHIRLNPRTKDLFIFALDQSTILSAVDFGEVGYGTVGALGLTVNELRSNEFAIFPDPQDPLEVVNWHWPGQPHPIPGGDPQGRTRPQVAVGLVYNDGSPGGTLGSTPSDPQQDVPYFNGTSRVFVAAVNAYPGDNIQHRDFRLGVYGSTAGHEVGHNVSLCHREEDCSGNPRPPACNDGATIDPQAVIPGAVHVMHSGFVIDKLYRSQPTGTGPCPGPAANPGRVVPTTYHANSRAQIRLHANDAPSTPPTWP